MAEISISIENKYFGGEHKVITLKQQFQGIMLLQLLQWILELSTYEGIIKILSRTLLYSRNSFI